MKIIETRTAPNARRVRIFLAEKGIEVAFEQIAFTTEALRSADYTRLNPMQKVPVLVLDDGTAISESVAICRYFEALHPTPALLGTTPLEQAHIEMWQRRVEQGLLGTVATAFRHLHPSIATMEVPQVPEWGEVNKPRAVEMLKIIDAQLARHAFIAGDAYSIADITALIAIDFMRPARIARPPELTHVERWYQAMAARPSTKA
jgi:glutathione S-transferase